MWSFDWTFLWTTLVALPVVIYAAPTKLEETTDAPFSVDASILAAAITCPRGIHGASGGVVLLVHGTASSGKESWSGSPYDVYLPYASPGFDVCWVEIPNNALGDAQVNAEYVAYNIPVLAKQSATGHVSVIGHSQGGGLNIQWALDFWPSTRQYVSDYVAIAGDFHGTVEGPIACLVEDLDSGGCHYSILQQTAGSKYLAAQNKRGGSALVTTTSLFTRYDDIIQNEIGSRATSILSGATNIAIQDIDICGPLHYVEHFTMLIDPAVYFLTYDALTHPGGASASRFDNFYCDYFTNQTFLAGYAPEEIAAAALALIRLFTPLDSPGARSLVEPPLKAYVCEQGQASVCGDT